MIKERRKIHSRRKVLEKTRKVKDEE